MDEELAHHARKHDSGITPELFGGSQLDELAAIFLPILDSDLKQSTCSVTCPFLNIASLCNGPIHLN